MAEPKVQVNVRLSPELHARLVTEAFKQVEPITAVVERALDVYLTRRKEKA